MAELDEAYALADAATAKCAAREEARFLAEQKSKENLRKERHIHSDKIAEKLKQQEIEYAAK